MMLANLPAPTREFAPPQAPVSASTALVSQTRKEPPPYGSQERARYVPRRQEDFGDGGAFAEVQVAQFPLDMGKKGQQNGVGSSSGRDTTLAVTVNADGEVNYDSILRQGRNKDKIIYSDHKSLVPKVDALREVCSASLCSPPSYAVAYGVRAARATSKPTAAETSPCRREILKSQMRRRLRRP